VGASFFLPHFAMLGKLASKWKPVDLKWTLLYVLLDFPTWYESIFSSSSIRRRNSSIWNKNINGNIGNMVFLLVFAIVSNLVNTSYYLHLSLIVLIK
jgi:hypothetical protein